MLPRKITFQEASQVMNLNYYLLPNSFLPTTDLLSLESIICTL